MYVFMYLFILYFSGNHRNSVQVEPEVSPCLEKRDRGATTGRDGEKNSKGPTRKKGTGTRFPPDNKPEVLLTFDAQKMEEKSFVNDTIDIFPLTTNARNPSAKVLDKPLKMRTSWEGCSGKKIKGIINGRDVGNIWGAPIRITGFLHYAAVIHLLIESWYKNKLTKPIDFLIGKFTVRMQPNDLYCSPIKKGEQDMKLLDKICCYATMETSKNFNKHFSEIAWFYINGMHDRVDRNGKHGGSYIGTPQDATALCAVLFSEVIRYPDMFFHNILLMQHLKTWDEFYENHPMLTGGSWNVESSDPDAVNAPEKVKERKQKNISNYVKKMRDKDKTGTLFQIAPQNEEADT